MPRNVEIKARIRDPEAAGRLAATLARQEPEMIRQHDTFYRCQAGRLKLRRFADGTGELIAYQRLDQHGPRTSSYTLFSTTEAPALAATLASALDQLGDVRKTRRFYLAGRTRIHLDEVEGLGWFLELEVVLDGDESPEDGNDEAARLMARFGVDPADLVSGSYLDLLTSAGKTDFFVEPGG